MADAADRAADELYALDPDDFTAARNRRAKELKAGGDKGAADAVKALAKPTLPAWALNQVARQQPQVVRALLDAGAELRRAQEDALAGDASGLRSASRDEQARIADVVSAASAVLREAAKQPSAAHVERMTATLRAAAIDAAAGELLQKGRLTTDLSPAGFGLDDLALSAPPPRAPAKKTKAGKAEKAAAAEDEKRAEQEALDRLRREATDAAADADEAERTAAAAEETAARAEEEARAAEERARHLAHEARTARSAATKVRHTADTAAARLRP